MFKGIVLIIILFLTTSCGTSYYFAQLESTDPYLEKTDKGAFRSGGDSIQIEYTFNGENSPIKIRVSNLGNRDVFVDWANSWLIIGDGDNNKVNLGSYMNDSQLLMRVQGGQIRTKSILELSGLRFHKIPEREFERKKVVLTNGKTASMSSADYSEETTPLYFQTSIACLFGSSDEEPIYFDESFYISNITKTKNYEPDEVAAYSSGYGDLFYTKKIHGKGLRKVLDISGSVLVVTGSIAIDVLLSSADND